MTGEHLQARIGR